MRSTTKIASLAAGIAAGLDHHRLTGHGPARGRRRPCRRRRRAGSCLPAAPMAVASAAVRGLPRGRGVSRRLGRPPEGWEGRHEGWDGWGGWRGGWGGWRGWGCCGWEAGVGAGAGVSALWGWPWYWGTSVVLEDPYTYADPYYPPPAGYGAPPAGYDAPPPSGYGPPPPAGYQSGPAASRRQLRLHRLALGRGSEQIRTGSGRL